MRTPEVAIIGAGPAGLFCAEELIKRGMNPYDIDIIDAGNRMVDRWCPETQVCACRSGSDLICHILEGEGGAGGFSDGKLPFSLTRGTQLEQVFDPSLEPVLWEIEDVVVRHGGEGVRYEPHPGEPGGFAQAGLEFGTYTLRHVGSDGVQRWSKSMTDDLMSRGVQFFFGMEVHMADGVTVTGRPRRSGGDEYRSAPSTTVLATGIQGIPWLAQHMEWLGIPLKPGPAGVGVRVEAPADDLAVCFEHFYDWKAQLNHESGIILRSFCCNDRGFVTNQLHRTMPARGVNGHSYLDPARKSGSSNFAVIAKIGEEVTNDPQEYVKDVVRNINDLVDGHTTVQTMKSFMNGTTDESTRPSWRTNVMARDRVDASGAMPPLLRDVFRDFMTRIVEAVPTLSPDTALVYAPEIKYPAKRVPADLSTFRVPEIDNLYVVGDATGYVDSFVAAALTGVVAARSIAD